MKVRIEGIIIRDSALLMFKGKGYNELWSPGGTLEPGETDEECLRRELLEEGGLELLSSTFFSEYESTSPYSRRTVKSRVYIADTAGLPVPGHEIQEAIWYTWEDHHKQRYPMIPIENQIIGHLIEAGIWEAPKNNFT